MRQGRRVKTPEFPEVVEATHEEAIAIGVSNLEYAIKCFKEGDEEHGCVFVDSALIWLGMK